MEKKEGARRKIRQNSPMRSGILFLSVPKSHTDLDPTLLYISIRGTYSNLLRESKMLTLGVRVFENGEGGVGQTVAAPMASWGEEATRLARGCVPCGLHQL